MSTRRLGLGIFLISAAILLTELLLTRIFSVTLYYHLSFMVVSLAMLGFGASGFAISAWPRRFPRERAESQLAWGAIVFALGTVVAVGACFNVAVSFDPQSFAGWPVVGLFALCAVPFLAGGVVVSLVLAYDPNRAHRLYFADLIGAAVGCLVFVPATNRLGAPTAVLGAGFVACLAAATFAGRKAPRLRIASIALAAVFVLAGVANQRSPFFDVRVVKGAPQPPSMALEWNSFSRVDVPGRAEDLYVPRAPAFAGYSSRLGDTTLVQETWLRYDADAATQITRFTGDLSRLAYLDFDVSSAAYQAKPLKRALVLGSGGGRDVLTALYRGAEHVTAVEINPITIRLMQTRFRTFSGGLYSGHPAVTVVNDDARAFLAHDPERYDVIEASLVDTWAASAAGAYALTENSLYTVEAFGDYLGHLTPNGIAAFNRWFSDPPVESLRVASLARAALRKLGVVDPGAHVLVVATDPAETGVTSLGSILLKRSPFEPREIDALRAWADDMAFVMVYAPDDRRRGTPQNEFHRLLSADADALIANYPFDIAPVTDDRPFFFSRVPLAPWVAAKLGLIRSPLVHAPLGLGGRTLGLALGISAVFTTALIAIPAIARRRRRTSSSEPPAFPLLPVAAYFGALGAGFMLVEVVLIHRFSTFLGHPSYALSVVLFTMLLAGGLGSLLGEKRAVSRTLTWLCALLTAYALFLPSLLDAVRGAELWFRVVFCVVATLPIATLMGMPFPAGLRAGAGQSRSFVPWAWAVNGAASVLGSSITVLVSMSYGFGAAMLLGAMCYATAILADRKLPRSPS